MRTNNFTSDNRQHIAIYRGMLRYLGEDVQYWGQELLVDHLLDLLGVPRSDVGDRPGGLLLDVDLMVFKEVVKGRERPVVQNALRLAVVTCHNVSDRPQGGGYHRHLVAVQKFN